MTWITQRSNEPSSPTPSCERGKQTPEVALRRSTVSPTPSAGTGAPRTNQPQVSKSTWLVERVDGPDDIPFLHWVGPTGGPLQARFVTDWPPGEEDVDYMHERVKRDPLTLEDAQAAEQLALEGFADAAVRPLAAHEADRLSVQVGESMTCLRRVSHAAGHPRAF